MPLGWQTGLRLGKLLALRWDDADWDARVLHVRRTLGTGGGAALYQAPKTADRLRDVPLAAVAVDVLRAHAARQRAERKDGLRDGKPLDDHGLVFCTRQGGALSPRNVERQWYHWRAAAEVPPYHFHALRHSFASLGLSAGIALPTIGELLGHTSYAFTKDRYAHLLPDARRQAADQWDAFISGRTRA